MYLHDVHKRAKLVWLGGRQTAREPLLFGNGPVNRAVDRWVICQATVDRPVDRWLNGQKFDCWPVDRAVDRQQSRLLIRESTPRGG